MEMLKDPKMAEQMASMASSMSPEALAAMANAQDGSRQWTPEMAKQAMAMMQDKEALAQAQRMMASLPPDQLQARLKAAHAGGVLPAAAAARPTAAGGGGGGPDMSAMAAAMEANPPTLPGGVKATPEMMKMSMEMMKNMSPEDMQRMMETAQKMGMGPGGMGGMGGMGAMGGMGPAASGTRAASGAAGSPAAAGPAMTPGQMPEMTPEMQAQMSTMMKDPAMMKSMTSMLKSLDPETMKSFGITDKAQLDKAAEAMEKMSPEQMERMMGVAMWFQRAYVQWKSQAWLRYTAYLLLLAFLWWTVGGWLSPWLLPSSTPALASEGVSAAGAAAAAAAAGGGVHSTPHFSGRAEAVVELEDEEDEEAGAPGAAEAEMERVRRERRLQRQVEEEQAPSHDDEEL